MVNCYCDASYDPETKTAICGWKIGDDDIKFLCVKNTNNTRAEIIGLIRLITNLDDQLEYIIYTDCESILNRIASKEKLIKCSFKNKRGIPLSNGDLYRQLFDLLNPNIKLVHIEGHLPVGQMNNHNFIFSKLDKKVRAKLRSKLFSTKI